MEILSFAEIISDPERVTYLLFITAIIVRLFTWFLDERSGKNYYKKYPVAKAMDDMGENGEMKSITSDEVESAILSIDPSASKEDQALQFEEYLKEKTLPVKTD